MNFWYEYDYSSTSRMMKGWWVSRTRLPTDWVIRQAFPAYKQPLTNHIAGNDKFLTAHISKCMFWNDEPSDYISREDKYLLNLVLYYSIGLKKMFFFYIYKSLTVRSWVNRTRFTVSLVYPSCRAERKRSINSNISCFF